MLVSWDKGLRFVAWTKPPGYVNPNYVAPSTDYMIDTVPAERWDSDIKMEEGYERFVAVINDVKQMEATLLM